MVLVKQWRICAKHPDGVDVLIPLALEHETVTVLRSKGDHVIFHGDLTGWLTQTLTIDVYKRACKGQDCCCGTGVFS